MTTLVVVAAFLLVVNLDRIAFTVGLLVSMAAAVLVAPISYLRRWAR